MLPAMYDSGWAQARARAEVARLKADEEDGQSGCLWAGRW